MARFFLSLAAGLGTALVVAMILVVLDLYLTGHGMGTISGPLVDWPRGSHLADHRGRPGGRGDRRVTCC